VKLQNGNVAARILPIQVHDLNSEDKSLLEQELGGVLRAIEFIYKEPGVNRPLSPKDSEEKNSNKTNYRNQINKAANAIEDVISSLKKLQTVSMEVQHDQPATSVGVRKKESGATHKKLGRINLSKALSGAAILAILIIAGILSYTHIFRRNALKSLSSSESRISVAVMPFRNMTNDTIWNVWQDGIQNNLITSLSNSEELKVRQIESTGNLIQSKGLNDYASITPTVAGKISQKLDADVFIYGTIKQSSATIRLNAQLIDSKTTETFKSFQIDGTGDKILQIIDSLSSMVKNFLIISKLGKEITPDYKNLASTSYPEAYRYFIYGKNAFMKGDYQTAVNMLSQATAVDSNFTFATIMLSFAYGNLGSYDLAKKSCLRIYEKRDQMPIQQKIYTNWAYASFFETPAEEIKYIRQFLEIDDQEPLFYFVLGESYSKLDQYEEAARDYEKALEIYDNWGTKPMWIQNYIKLGFAYHKTGRYEKERKLYRRAEQNFPNNKELIFRQAVLSLIERDTISANRYLEEFISICKDASIPESDILIRLADLYWEAALLNKAEECYRKSYSLEPESPEKLNRLAWFLIENDRNINEAMRLIDKALVLKPDNSNYIDTKGWGLYKLGKYKEALAVLEKSWELQPTYSNVLYLHIQEVKKEISGQGLDSK
jgi:tetratricopeptide (TPR) repeat protein